MATNYAPGLGPKDQESAASLISRLINDGSALVRSEIALAKAELATAATNAKAGAAALAIASVVMLAGALALIAALILGLAEAMAPWAAALIVGAVLAIIGLAMFATAKRKLLATKHPLTRTQTSLQQDAAMLARRS
jgi:hypothetical protein